MKKSTLTIILIVALIVIGALVFLPGKNNTAEIEAVKTKLLEENQAKIDQVLTRTKEKEKQYQVKIQTLEKEKAHIQETAQKKEQETEKLKVKLTRMKKEREKDNSGYPFKILPACNNAYRNLSIEITTCHQVLAKMEEILDNCRAENQSNTSIIAQKDELNAACKDRNAAYHKKYKTLQEQLKIIKLTRRKTKFKRTATTFIIGTAVGIVTYSLLKK